MSAVPANLRYTDSHEWILIDGDEWVIGITDHAQSALGDVVFVGEVEVGAALDAGQEGAVIESVKAVGHVYAPVAGVVTAYNEALDDKPGLLNTDPYGNWVLKIKPSAAVAADFGLSAQAYAELVAA